MHAMADADDDASIEDKTLAEWLYQDQFAGKPYRDFIPPGTLSTIRVLLDDPALEWPWPYNDVELEEILALLPQESHDAYGRQIVHIARVYLAKLWVRVQGPKSKPDPIEELSTLKEAANALLRAIKSLSDEARDMLVSRQRLYSPNAPSILRLRHAVDATQHSLHGLPEPQPIDRRGRKINELERKFQAAIGQIYDQAFAGVRPARGFPVFQKAVTEPLNRGG
jgi:hypothetical protein